MDEESLLTETVCFFRMSRTSTWSQVSYDSLSNHSILLNSAAVRLIIHLPEKALSVDETGPGYEFVRWVSH